EHGQRYEVDERDLGGLPHPQGFREPARLTEQALHEARVALADARVAERAEARRGAGRDADEMLKVAGNMKRTAHVLPAAARVHDEPHVAGNAHRHAIGLGRLARPRLEIERDPRLPPESHPEPAEGPLQGAGEASRLEPGIPAGS